MVHWRGDIDVDTEPSPQERADINKLISAELPPDYKTTLHPSIPDLPPVQFSPLMQEELDRIRSNLPLSRGVDLSRYEAPEPPETSAESRREPAKILDDWRQILCQAYAASSHLSTRRENLKLLEEHGKNAWLIGNAQLEEILRQVEKELQEARESADSVNRQRKMMQETASGELAGLQDTWKRGVGGIIDVELAAEALRMEILEKRRQQSQSLSQ
jgi:pre-mRNA-splicing factor SPF27